jgi:hypothetical protein
MKGNQIANSGMGAERASKTASFSYISDSDLITTQILNWSQGSGFATMWYQPKNRGFGVVQFFDGVSRLAIVPVCFQPGPRTELLIWNHC